MSNPVTAQRSRPHKIGFGTLSYERYVGLKKRVIEPGKNYQDLLSFYQTVLSQDRVPFKAVKK